MRERSELARKGIARGRSVVALAYADGVLFVAENPSRSLQKISEIYDRVGFAAAGKFNEFDNLRRGSSIRRHPRLRLRPPRRHRSATGQRVRPNPRHHLHRAGQALRGRVVRGRGRALRRDESPELYRITYDGSIADEPHYVVMGGTTEPITTALKESYTENADLPQALRIALDALRAGSAESSTNGQATLSVTSLEVAVLDANRPRRAFKRIHRSKLEALLEESNTEDSKEDGDAEGDESKD